MDLISLIVVLAVVGVLLWGINRFIPMQENIRQILNVVVVVAVFLYVVMWLLGLAGIGSIRVG